MDATLSLLSRRLDGVEIHEEYNLTHCLISTQV